MATKKADQKFRITHRLTYINVVYPEGAIVEAAENGWSDADIKNLVAGGDMVPLSDGELADLEATNKARGQQTTQANIDDVDKVVAKVRGEDVMFIDHRVKGPNEEPIGEREPTITRLPPGDIPSDAPLAIHDTARSATPSKMKVAKPEPAPPRPADEAALVSGGGEEETKRKAKK